MSDFNVLLQISQHRQTQDSFEKYPTSELEITEDTQLYP